MALTDNLVAYWKLDEASGTRNDSHGTSHLTDNNTVGSATGKINNAASFVAANQERLSCVDSASVSTGDIDFSLACWCKFTSLSARRTLIARWNTSGVNQREYFLEYDNSSNAFRFIVSSNGTTIETIVATTFGAPTTGVWYFVVAWHDAINNQIGIAVNAGSADTKAWSSGVFNSTSDLDIGGNTSTNLWHDGSIDEVGFWKRVLASQDRTDLYNSGAGFAYPFGSALTLSVSDAMSISETRANEDRPAKTDALTVAESLALETGKLSVDALEMSEVFAKVTGKAVADGVLLGELMAKGASKSIADALALGESVDAALAIVLALSDAISAVDSLAKSVSKPATDALTIGETVSADLVYFLIIALSDAISLGEALAKTIRIHDANVASQLMRPLGASFVSQSLTADFRSQQLTAGFI